MTQKGGQTYDGRNSLRRGHSTFIEHLSFNHSAIQHLLSAYYVPGMGKALGARMHITIP